MGLGESRNLFQTETPSRICVSVTNSINTPRDYCVKKHVYRPCSSTKCMCKMSLKPIEKLLDKVCFYQQHYKFLSINSFINFFFEGTRKFRITGRAGPSPNYVIRFFHFEFKKGTEYEVILRDWRRWHWEVSYSSKLLLSRNFIYNKLKAVRNTQTPA